MILYSLLSEELFQIQLGLLLYSSFGLLSSVFLFLTPPSFFVFLVFPSAWCRVLVSAMAEPFRCFWTSDRNLVWRLVAKLAYSHCTELMKPVGKLLERSHYYTCYCSLSMNKFETIIAVYTVSVRVPSELILPFHVFLHPCSLVLIRVFSFI